MSVHSYFAWKSSEVNNDKLNFVIAAAVKTMPLPCLEPRFPGPHAVPKFRSIMAVSEPWKASVTVAIAGLDRSLRQAGTQLHVRMGSPEVELPAAVRAYGADAVYAVALSDPASLERLAA